MSERGGFDWAEARVSLYESGERSAYPARGVHPPRLGDVVAAIRGGDEAGEFGRRLLSLTAEYRGRILPQERVDGLTPRERQLTHAAVVNAWKHSRFPPITPTGVWGGSRQHTNNVVWSRVLLYDLDHVEDAAEARDDAFDRLSCCPFAFVTASGEGVAVALLVDRDPLGRQEYPDFWHFGRLYLEREFGLSVEWRNARGGVDQSCKDPTRLRFLCHDAGIRIRMQPDPLHVPRPDDLHAAVEAVVDPRAARARASGVAAGAGVGADPAGQQAQEAGAVGAAGAGVMAGAGRVPEWLTAAAETPEIGAAGGPADIECGAGAAGGAGAGGYELPDDVSAHVDAVLASGRFDPTPRNIWLQVGMALKGLVLDGRLDDADACDRWDRWSAQSGNYGDVVETWASFRRPEYGYMSVFGLRAGGSGRGAHDGGGAGGGEQEPDGWTVEVEDRIGFGGRVVGMVRVEHSREPGVRLFHVADLRDLDEERRVADASVRALLPTPNRDAEIGRVHRAFRIARQRAAQGVGRPEVLDIPDTPPDEAFETYPICGIPAPVGGVTILYGRGGSLKSQIAVHTAVQQAAQGRRVLCLDTEPFDSRIKAGQVACHVAASANPARARENLRYVVLRGWNMHAARELRSEYRDFDLVTFDSATAAVSDDINDSSAAAQFYELLRLLRIPTALVVCHTAKQNHGAAAESTSPLGTQTWESAARLTIMAAEMKQQQEAPEFAEITRRARLQVSKSNCATRKGLRVDVTVVFERGATRVSACNPQEPVDQDAEDQAQRIERAVETLSQTPEGISPSRFEPRMFGENEGSSAAIAAFRADGRAVQRPYRGGSRWYHVNHDPQGGQEGDGDGDNVRG